MVRRLAFLVALATLGSYALTRLTGPHGWRKLIQNDEEIRHLEDENGKLEHDVKELERRNHRLEHDPEYIKREIQDRTGKMPPDGVEFRTK
ncbi:MAG: septum formation initiator family protein [Bryobacteraceae bacterium]